MTEENKEYIKQELEKLHELSMKMEEIVTDLDNRITEGFDVGYIRGNIEIATADIQDLIEDLSAMNTAEDADILVSNEYPEEPEDSEIEYDEDLLIVEQENFNLYNDRFDR